MRDLEKWILKMIHQGNYIENEYCSSINFESNDVAKVVLSIKTDLTFSYLKLDNRNENEITVSLPSDDEFKQLVDNLTPQESVQYRELESMLSKTQLKTAVGLAFIH